MPRSVPLPARVGGRLCLDFVNTVDPRTGSGGRDYFTSFDAVLDWFAAGDVDLPRSTTWLSRRARQSPGQGVSALEATVQLRESLFAVIDASRRSADVASADLSVVNAALGESIGQRTLAPSPRGGVVEGWRRADTLLQVLWPVAIDAWDLLTEPELYSVRQCPPASGGCGWLFLDSSRSGNRRWCDMRTCGNRAKVRAHYSRTSGAAS